MFEELENLTKDSSKRMVMPKDAKCYVCNNNKTTARLRRFNQYCLCTKHYLQLEKYHKITDPLPTQHKTDLNNLKCCVCGEVKMGSYEGKPYCRRHYLQMVRHGHLISTMYEPNEWVDHGDYYECILKSKNNEVVGKTKIDKEDYPKLKDYKLYQRLNNGKPYAVFSIKGTSKKNMVHRFLMGLENTKYTIDKVVDHINGDSLDNRRSNLRVCSQHQNSLNIHKKGKIIGVKFIPHYNGTNNHKWEATICSNYRNLHLGYFNSQEEAAIARIKKEKEICGVYGPNKDLYYILNHPSPIEELKRKIQSFSEPSEGV